MVGAWVLKRSAQRVEAWAIFSVLPHGSEIRERSQSISIGRSWRFSIWKWSASGEGRK